MTAGRKISAAALALAILILLGIIAALIPAKLDLTQDHLYTLSPGTQRILGGIKEPLALEFYFSQSADGLDAAYKNYAARIREMLRQYAADCPEIELRVIDPKPDTPEEERATRLGLEPQRLRSGGRIFLGLAAIQADSKKIIASFSPRRESYLEYDISQLIYSVGRIDRPKLGLLSTLPLMGQPAMPWAGRQATRGAVVAGEWEKTFEIVSVPPSATELPADLAALAVIHPHGLSPQMEYAIDQYILSGKPVFLALDPHSRFFRAQSGGQQMFGAPQPGISSDLRRLLKAYGIVFDSGSVVGDPDASTMVQGRDGQPVPYPAALDLGPSALAGQLPFTNAVRKLLLVDAGALSIEQGSALELQPVLRTSAHAGTLPAMMLGMGDIESIGRSLVPGKEPATLAAIIRGHLKSAFPEGKPAAEAPPSESKKPEPSAPGLKESAKPATIMVFGDSDWLLDDFCLDPRLISAGIALPVNDNLSLAAGALESLGGSEDLLSVRGKRDSLRPFTVVRDLERAAQERYQAALAELDKKVQDYEQQIVKLQEQQTQNKLLVADDALQRSLDEVRQQEASARAERREIRRALREEIDSLETRLALVSLLPVPLGVSAFGLWFFWQRGRRRALTA